MMQFREIPLPSPTLMNKSLLPHRTLPPWPGFLTSKAAALGNFGDATCMEQLLIHCAKAIESNDSTLTQQILWVLNNIASPDGDSNQRLTCGFLRALLSRASRNGNCTSLVNNNNAINVVTNTHRFSIIELASFVDLTPWYRFGFTAANAAIVEALEGYSMIHIVDLSPTHCMQIPTLIDAIATRFEGPPPLLLKLTVVAMADVINYPPVIDIGYEDLGSRLVNFARSRNIVMEFRVIPTCCSDGFSSLIEQLHLQQISRAENNEALVINCHMMLHYIPDESVNPNTNLSLRTMFLKSIRSFNPTVVMLIDEDADFTSNNLVSRLSAAFNYFWIPYDTVDSFFQIGSKQRQWYEADICWKIENVIAYEGIQRIERLEPKNRWVQRMKNESFKEISFSEDAFCEVKNMVDEHAAGWGLKKEEDGIVLTWKGHNVVFATVWVPT